MTALNKEFFADIYEHGKLWVMVRPQSCFVKVQDQIKGDVLDIGCGAGYHSIYFAQRGCRVVGIDFVPEAIEKAKQGAKQEGLNITFQVGSALELDKLPYRFDSVIDSGLYHVIPKEDEQKYINGLKVVMKPGGRLFLLGFSDAEPNNPGPKRMTRKDLETAFADGFVMESIEPAILETHDGKNEAQGWFTVIRRK